MAKLEFSSITKSYGSVQVLRNVSASIAKGELVTLLGPSGCGKTTLLRAIAGLVTPDSGQISVDGSDITATPIHRRHIGMVFQAHALFPHMSVVENVAFGLKMQGNPREDRLRRATEVLGIVRLGGFEKRMPHELSGGQQQRVAIARAIATNPEVMLLDEPFGALDRKLRERLQVELRQLVKDLSITTIFVTHDQEEALVLSDRIAVMNEGVIQQIAAPDVVFEAPSNPFVADFMGIDNIFAAVVAQGDSQGVRLDHAGQAIQSQDSRGWSAGERISYGVRAEHIAITPEALDAAQRPNRVSGPIVSAIYRGDRWNYVVDTPLGRVNVKAAADGAPFAVHSRVDLEWKPRSVVMFNALPA